MTLLNRLEPKLGRFSIPNLTAIIIAGQVLLYVASRLPAGVGPQLSLNSIQLEPDKVMQGEVWRLVAFVFDPPRTNVIFAFFAWYLFYLMGTALENIWGTFQYNVFLGIGYVASLAMAFVAWFAAGIPGQVATNLFLGGTVFLAFARFYPDFTLLVMFILPVKIRWLAMLTWIYYGCAIPTGQQLADAADDCGVGAELLRIFRPRYLAGRQTWASANAISGEGDSRARGNWCIAAGCAV